MITVRLNSCVQGYNADNITVSVTPRSGQRHITTRLTQRRQEFYVRFKGPEDSESVDLTYVNVY